MKSLQLWEGTVESVEDDDFVAVLRDLSSPEFPNEQVRLSKEDVATEDMKLLAPGAVFYWFVGRSTREHGQVERISSIRFRRLPMWTRRRFQRAAERSEGLAAALRYEP